MAELELGSPHTFGAHRPVPGPSADTAAMELRAWRERSRALEPAADHPWPERQAARLVDAMVCSTLRDDPSALEPSAREWAHTSPSLGVFARRLGTLRAGFGAHVPTADPTARERLRDTVDRVAVACTAEWLTTLGLTHAAPLEARPHLEASGRHAGLAKLRTDRRIRHAGVAVLAGAAAAAAVFALATAPHTPRPSAQANRRASVPTPALTQPPAGDRRTEAFLAAMRRPSTGGPASGRAVRGSGTLHSEIGTSAVTPPPDSSAPAPPVVPGPLPGAVTVPPVPVPSIPLIPAAPLVAAVSPTSVPGVRSAST